MKINLKLLLLLVALVTVSNFIKAQCNFDVNSGGFDYNLDVVLNVDSAIYTQSGSTCNVEIILGYDVTLDTVGAVNPSWWNVEMYTLQGNFNCIGGSGSSFFNLPNGGGQGAVTSAIFSYANTVCSTVVLDCPITLDIQGPQLSANATNCGSLAITTPLPLALAMFSFTSVGANDIVVSWQTLAENNMSHFSLEQSTDLKTWKEINRQQATNLEMESNYYFDMHRSTVDQYLRLKMIDEDGRKEYSKVISIEKGKEQSISIYPNPVTSQLQLSGIQANQVEITNSLGQIIQPQVLNNTSIDVASWPKGFYFLRAKNDSQAGAIKFIKK